MARPIWSWNVEGQTLQHWLDSHQRDDAEQDARDIVRIGSALAIAAHSIHQQNVCHLTRSRQRAVAPGRQRGAAGFRPVLPRALPRPAG